jgi:hypothetical protein
LDRLIHGSFLDLHLELVAGADSDLLGTLARLADRGDQDGEHQNNEITKVGRCAPVSYGATKTK